MKLQAKSNPKVGLQGLWIGERNLGVQREQNNEGNRGYAGDELGEKNIAGTERWTERPPC
jgi:hypothetical protein